MTIDTKKLRFILEGIRDSHLAYQSQFYFCKNGLDVAGWVLRLEHPTWDLEDLDKVSFDENKIYQTPWTKAQRILGLQYNESKLFFSRDVPLNTMFNCLRFLEDGNRLRQSTDVFVSEGVMQIDGIEPEFKKYI